MIKNNKGFTLIQAALIAIFLGVVLMSVTRIKEKKSEISYIDQQRAELLRADAELKKFVKKYKTLPAFVTNAQGIPVIDITNNNLTNENANFSVNGNPPEVNLRDERGDLLFYRPNTLSFLPAGQRNILCDTIGAKRDILAVATVPGKPSTEVITNTNFLSTRSILVPNAGYFLAHPGRDGRFTTQIRETNADTTIWVSSTPEYTASVDISGTSTNVVLSDDDLFVFTTLDELRALAGCPPEGMLRDVLFDSGDIFVNTTGIMANQPVLINFGPGRASSPNYTALTSANEAFPVMWSEGCIRLLTANAPCGNLVLENGLDNGLGVGPNRYVRTNNTTCDETDITNNWRIGGVPFFVFTNDATIRLTRSSDNATNAVPNPSPIPPNAQIELTYAILFNRQVGKALRSDIRIRRTYNIICE